MAEYKQYLTESEEGDLMEVKKGDNEEKRKQIESKKNKEEKTEDEDDVVFIVHKWKHTWNRENEKKNKEINEM